MNPSEDFAAGERVFEEPWQAQAFALTVELHKQGAFTWTEWAAALSAQLRGPDHGGGGEHYYAAWLAALETLTTAKGLVDAPALVARKADWAQAYEHTPHGRPVELGRATQPYAGLKMPHNILVHNSHHVDIRARPAIED